MVSYIDYIFLEKDKNRLIFKNRMMFMVMILTVFSAVIPLITITNALFTPQFEAPKIDYSQLNIEEYNFASTIINKIDPIYFNGKTIKFIKNIPKGQPYNWGGMNIAGNILIYYDETYLQTTICHELLHSVNKAGIKEHEITYDLAQKGVCYNG